MVVCPCVFSSGDPEWRTGSFLERGRRKCGRNPMEALIASSSLWGGAWVRECVSGWEPVTGAHIPLAKVGIREGIPPSGKLRPAEERVGEGLGIRTRSTLSSGQSDNLCRGSLSAQEPLEPSLKDRGAGSHPGCALQGWVCSVAVLCPFTTILSLVPFSEGTQSWFAMLKRI